MGQKHIKLQSQGQDSQQRERERVKKTPPQTPTEWRSLPGNHPFSEQHWRAGGKTQ